MYFTMALKLGALGVAVISKYCVESGVSLTPQPNRNVTKPGTFFPQTLSRASPCQPLIGRDSLRLSQKVLDSFLIRASPVLRLRWALRSSVPRLIHEIIPWWGSVFGDHLAWTAGMRRPPAFGLFIWPRKTSIPACLHSRYPYRQTL